MIPRRLYFYSPEFPAAGEPLNGGVERAIHGLASGLVRAGVEVGVLADGDDAGSVETTAGYTVHGFPRTRRAPFALSRPLAAFVEERARNGAVVVLNGMFSPGMYAMARLLRRRNLPYIMAPYDPYSPDVFRGRAVVKAIYWRLIESDLLRGARLIQVMDRRHETYLRQRRIPTPVCVSPAGYDDSAVIAESDLEWRTDGPARLFFLGRFDARNKGLDLLIEACVRLASGLDLALTLQGTDRGDRRALERLAATTVAADRIHFRAPDFARSSSELIAEHDIYCMPSRFEGFGIAGLEAMLAGRVVLVSEVAGLAPHVAESDSGVVIAPSTEGIVEGLRRLLARRSEWREMGLRDRRHVLERLHWDAIAASTLEQYRSVLAGKPGRA